MPTKKPRRRRTIIHSVDEIPDFQSEAEMAEFWDTHEVSDEMLAQAERLPDDVLAALERARAYRDAARRRHDDALRAIFAANADREDLERRMRVEGLTASYDRDSDTLIIRIGKPREATTESIANRLLLRVDPDTLKYVGFEVLGFKALLRERPKRMKPLLDALDVIDAALTAEPHQPSEREAGELARGLRQLVPA